VHRWTIVAQKSNGLASNTPWEREFILAIAAGQKLKVRVDGLRDVIEYLLGHVPT
jgi:hypothetical protein